MKTVSSTLVLAAVSLLLCATALASEEEILQPHKVSVWVDGGSAFKEVAVTIEITKGGKKTGIGSVHLTVAGKPVAVPREAYDDLPLPLLNSLEIRTEVGYDKHPWLYITFTIPHRSKDGKWNPKRVYIAYQNGRIVYRAVKYRGADGQWKWDRKKLPPSPE